MDTIEQLLRDGWVVLAGDLKKQRSVYKITGRGMQRYATLVVALYGEDERHISKKSMLGGPKLSKLTADNWPPNAEYEDVVRELGNNGMLTESVDGLELSEKGMNYVKTMFDIEGKPKEDPLKEAVGGKTVSGKGDDKVAGYLLKAVTFMGKIADGGAKMDRMLNGTKGGIGTKKGKYKKKQRGSNTINNYYYSGRKQDKAFKSKTKKTKTKTKIPAPKQNVIKKIRSETRYDVKPVNRIVERVVDDDVEPVVNDEFANVASENADIGKEMFGTFDYESGSDDTDYQKIWEDTANENEKFVNDMFGFDGNTKSKKKRSKKDEDYW